MNYYVIPNQIEAINQSLRQKISLNKEVSRFEQIRKEFDEKSESYLVACKSLAKTVRGISFDQKKRHFVVRPTVLGSRVFLGTEKNFDDAKKLLDSYLKYKGVDL